MWVNIKTYKHVHIILIITYYIRLKTRYLGQSRPSNIVKAEMNSISNGNSLMNYWRYKQTGYDLYLIRLEKHTSWDSTIMVENSIFPPEKAKG